MTAHIETEEQLEDRLASISDADVAAASSLGGDLLILGVGGKMGPSLARLATRAVDKAGRKVRVFAVARFSNPAVKASLEASGIETIACDLLDERALKALPDAPNVIFMAGRKFGTTGAEHLTWAMNTYLPGLVAERFRNSRIVAFSTGNVYPFRSVLLGGATEETPVAPAGEYAQSALGRERLLEYVSDKWKTPVAILRLNYAIDLRYGVLSDVGRAVYEKRPVDLRVGAVNVIWQRDANSICLRSLAYCASPPAVLNVSGPETLSVRYLAEEFGSRFGLKPTFTGEEGAVALLTNAAKSHRLFGYPTVAVQDMLDWTAHWIRIGGSSLHKPTRFEVGDGRF